MKPLLFLAASALVAGASAACTPMAPPAARAALDCPATRGHLTRTSEAPDHKTCTYTSRNGDEVSLRLVSFTGSVEAALKPIQDELDAQVAPVADAAKDDKAANATVGKSAAADASRAQNEASADAKADAKSGSKGVTISAKASLDDDDEGDHGSGGHKGTRVDLPGIHISANEDGKADVNVGMVHVNANDDGAVVRISHDVRLRGESFSRQKRGIRSTYILAKDNLKDGYRAVGYEAAGPRTGPITVAVVKSRNGDHDDLFHEVQRLVRINGGV